MESVLEYNDGDDVFEAFVVSDDVSSRMPAILICPAWDGPNDILRDRARGFAQTGLVAIVLDVYGKGIRGQIDGDNSHLMTPLLADRALLRRRLLAGFELARGLPYVDPTRIVAFGPCFGGLCALDLARASPSGLAAAIAVHAPLAAPPWPGGSIAARVLVLHGWEDPTAPPTDVLALAQELTTAGADWQLHAYGHAMHAFTFPGAQFPERGLLYDPRAASRAQHAITRFLDEVLA